MGEASPRQRLNTLLCVLGRRPDPVDDQAAVSSEINQVGDVLLNKGTDAKLEASVGDVRGVLGRYGGLQLLVLAPLDLIKLGDAFALRGVLGSDLKICVIQRYGRLRQAIQHNMHSPMAQFDLVSGLGQAKCNSKTTANPGSDNMHVVFG